LRRGGQVKSGRKKVKNRTQPSKKIKQGKRRERRRATRRKGKNINFSGGKSGREKLERNDAWGFLKKEGGANSPDGGKGKPKPQGREAETGEIRTRRCKGERRPSVSS